MANTRATPAQSSLAAGTRTQGCQSHARRRSHGLRAAVAPQRIAVGGGPAGRLAHRLGRDGSLLQLQLRAHQMMNCQGSSRQMGESRSHSKNTWARDLGDECAEGCKPLRSGEGKEAIQSHRKRLKQPQPERLHTC